MKPVEIEIYALDLLSIDGCQASVRVNCSTRDSISAPSRMMPYFRLMGCGAFLKSLRRTASGDFKIEDARTLEQLADLSSQGSLEEALIPASRMLPQFPSETVDQITEGQIRNGRDFRVSPFRDDNGARYVKALSAAGDLVAIGEVRLPHVYHPVLLAATRQELGHYFLPRFAFLFETHPGLTTCRARPSAKASPGTFSVITLAAPIYASSPICKGATKVGIAAEEDSAADMGGMFVFAIIVARDGPRPDV